MRHALATAAAILVIAACKPQPLPPEPPHTITLGDASFTGDTCEIACDVLDALRCGEAFSASPGKCVSLCRIIGDDFDYACVARAHDTDALHACNVRCDPGT